MSFKTHVLQGEDDEIDSQYLQPEQMEDPMLQPGVFGQASQPSLPGLPGQPLTTQPGKKRKKISKQAGDDDGLEELISDAEEARAQQEEILSLAKDLISSAKKEKEEHRKTQAEQSQNIKDLLSMLKDSLN